MTEYVMGIEMGIKCTIITIVLKPTALK